MIRMFSALLLAGGLFVLVLPLASYADSAPSALPPGFMPLNGARDTRPLAAAMQHNEQATLLRSADAQPLPSGFMPIDRARIRPLTPSRDSKVTGSVHMVRKKQPLVTIGEEDAGATAMSVVEDAERELASLPVFRDVVRNVGAKVRHAWPLPQHAEQRFSSAFGMRSDPFTHQPRFHEGVDIAAASGTPVLASADGMVEAVTRGDDFGKYVTVKHRDGTATIYGHLSKQSVHEGQRVRQGQKLGEVGSTGRSTGPHLHFQIEENGKAYNPLAAVTPPWKRGIGVAMKAHSH